MVAEKSNLEKKITCVVFHTLPVVIATVEGHPTLYLLCLNIFEVIPIEITCVQDGVPIA